MGAGLSHVTISSLMRLMSDRRLSEGDPSDKIPSHDLKRACATATLFSPLTSCSHLDLFIVRDLKLCTIPAELYYGDQWASPFAEGFSGQLIAGMEGDFRILTTFSFGFITGRDPHQQVQRKDAGRRCLCMAAQRSIWMC